MEDGTTNPKIESVDAIYKPQARNWYTAKPYGFIKTSKGSSSGEVMFLPISPSNLMITTQFATNMITTLYGTIEEHSPVRYYDIQIEGTTGIAPKYIGSNTSSPGRRSFSVQDGISLSAGGFFSKTLNVIQNSYNKAKELLSPSKPETGVEVGETGYLAFHNLYRFLLQYKKDASGTQGNIGIRTRHPLKFFNYKDGNQYDVVVRAFTLRRSAENPMLYYYSISLRGYNLQSIASSKDFSEEQVKQLEALGLPSRQNTALGTSVFSQMKRISSSVKSVIGPALGGNLNFFGG